MSPPSVAKKASVWLSRQCNCIYRNLALEDWIFERNSFADEDGLLIWRNRSAVVIGRHQNPWTELNAEYVSRCGVDVARRRSGGGTVYHDMGNMNICVFTNKARHKRDENLRFVAKVLKERWNVDADVSKRHDLMLDGKYKISGTAAKLTHDKAYHHFTLMLDVDVNGLWSSLTPSMLGIVSNATTSTRTEVRTLASVGKRIEYDALRGALVDEFRSRYEQSHIHDINSITNAQFDNIETIVDEFRTWHWIYGMTPPFSIRIPLTRERTITLVIHIEKGIVSRFSIDKQHMNGDNRCELETILNSSSYVGCRFEPALCKSILQLL